MTPSLQLVPTAAPKTGLHNICSLPDIGAKPSGDAHPTADILPAIPEDNQRSADGLLALLRFKKFCKAALTALSLGGLISMSDPDRPAHRLVECVRAYLEFRLASRESQLRVGYREFRWDPDAVALRNAINFLNQAQVCEKACPCAYCAGAPFYASKKPAQSIGLAKAKSAGF